VVNVGDVNGEAFRIEARFERFRYLFSDGNVLDVESPYRADSTDRGAVLEEAARRWGKADRKIEGVSVLAWSQPTLPGVEP
jgi:hypothetical protein